MLQRKYLNELHIHQTLNGKKDSYFSRSITKPTNILTLGFITCVGRGERVPHVDKMILILHIYDVCYNGVWNFDHIPTHLLRHIKMEMESICIIDESDDNIVWEPYNFGTYTTKSIYYWLTLLLGPNLMEVMSWSWTWKLKFLENVRHFTWVVKHEKLSKNQVLYHHISPYAFCYRCGASSESILHLLCDCPKARQVWHKLKFDF